MKLLRQILAQFPSRWQTHIKRIHFGRQIKKGTFFTNEPEYNILQQLLNPGDWVVDVGANVGHYTKRFSELVGEHGRVIAFEPVPTTFSLLASNAQLFSHENVSLVNAAVSDKLDIVGMSLPKFSTGLTNYYQAHLSVSSGGALSVIALPLDQILIKKRIALVKIDAEGHELLALLGMTELIEKYKPILIIETGSNEVISKLSAIGYQFERLPNSPNLIFKYIA